MTVRSWALAGAAVVLAVVLGVWTWSCRARHREQTATAQAAQHNTAATTAAAQGAVHDQTAESQKPALTADAAEVARLRTEVARLRAAAARPPVPDPLPGVPIVEPPAGDPDLAPLVAQQDALIQAQDRQIQDLQGQVLNLTAARDSWRTAAMEREKEAAAERIAHEAALAAIKAERWKGRIEGFLVGAAGGYLTGRLN